MANITQAFENLNRSLRHISDSNRLAKQSQRQHQRSMAELQDKINDPRTKLLRAQAAEQLKPTEINSPIGTPTGLVDTIYNRTLTGEFNNVLHKKGAELKNGKIMVRGTNEAYTEPAWQAKQTQRDLAILSTIGALPGNRKKVELAHLQQTEENFKSTTSGDMNPFQDRARQRNKTKLEKAQKDIADPIEMHKTLRDNRIHLKRAYQEALGSRDDTITKRIGDMLELNLKEEIAMGKTSKDQKAYNYSVLRKDGSTSTIKRYYFSGQPIPNMFKMNGEIYQRGTQTKPFKDSDGGSITTAKKRLELKNKKIAAVKSHTILKTNLAVIDNEINQEQFIQQFLAQGRGNSEEGKVKFAELLKTANEPTRESWRSQLLNMEDTYGDEAWFWNRRKKDREDYQERNKAYNKEHNLTDKKRMSKRKPTKDDPDGLGLLMK